LKKVSDSVPGNLTVQPIQWSSPTTSNHTLSKKVLSSTPSVVSARGMVQLLPESAASTDVHYELLVDGKPVYYLQDMPQMFRFAHTIVNVEDLSYPTPRNN